MKKQKGFTLIELLIVVAIIGIIAAIAIPNLLSAIQRAKQKRAMSEVRTIATAAQSYATDTNIYPIQTAGPLVSGAAAVNLTPDYVKVIPNPDPWNTPYYYAGTTYMFNAASFGKDMSPDGWNSVNLTTSATTEISTTCFECDIVWQGDTFEQLPNGPQHTCK
ncbi:MAG: prepilin-type N-terminal cleavage/methylation domain-containing protein [Acidobacteriota bacterium]